MGRLPQGKVAAFGALSPVVRPPRDDSVASRLRRTLDGIKQGTERERSSVPDGDELKQGKTSPVF